MEQGLDKLHGGLLFGEGVLGPHVCFGRCVWGFCCVCVGVCRCSVPAAPAGCGLVCRHGASSNPGTRILGVASYCCVFFVPGYAVLPHPWPATAVGWFQPVGSSGHRNLCHMLALLSSPAGTRPGYRSLPGWARYSVFSQRGRPVPALSPGAGRLWRPGARGEACTPLPACRAIAFWVG